MEALREMVEGEVVNGGRSLVIEWLPEKAQVTSHWRSVWMCAIFGWLRKGISLIK